MDPPAAKVSGQAGQTPLQQLTVQWFTAMIDDLAKQPKDVVEAVLKMLQTYRKHHPTCNKQLVDAGCLQLLLQQAANAVLPPSAQQQQPVDSPSSRSSIGEACLEMLVALLDTVGSSAVPQLSQRQQLEQLLQLLDKGNAYARHTASHLLMRLLSLPECKQTLAQQDYLQQLLAMTLESDLDSTASKANKIVHVDEAEQVLAAIASYRSGAVALLAKDNIPMLQQYLQRMLALPGARREGIILRAIIKHPAAVTALVQHTQLLNDLIANSYVLTLSDLIAIHSADSPGLAALLKPANLAAIVAAGLKMDGVLSLIIKKAGSQALIQGKHVAALVAAAQAAPAHTSRVLEQLAATSQGAAELIQNHLSFVLEALEHCISAADSCNPSAAELLRLLARQPAAAAVMLKQGWLRPLCKWCKVVVFDSDQPEVKEIAASVLAALLINGPAVQQFVESEAAAGGLSVTSLITTYLKESNGQSQQAKAAEQLLRAIMQHDSGLLAIVSKQNLQLLVDSMLEIAPDRSPALKMLIALSEQEMGRQAMQQHIRGQLEAAEARLCKKEVKASVAEFRSACRDLLHQIDGNVVDRPQKKRRV